MKRPKEIKLKKIIDGDDGILYVAEEKKEIPFPIKRVYFIDQVTFGSLRGFHAHKQLNQIIVCLRGRFELEMYDGKNKSSYYRIHSGGAVSIPPMVWHSMRKFTRDCLIAVFASDYFDERDYIRSFHNFKHLVK